VNDTFTVGTRTWIWDGTTWELVATSSDPIQKTIVDAKGDLIAGTTSDAVARLAVGTNGQVLTADSAETTGLKWATPAAGGGALVLISTASPSSVTSVTFDNVFTSTYRNYVMYLNLVAVSGGLTTFVFRTGGVDNTNSNYNRQNFVVDGTSTSASQNTSGTSGLIAALSDNEYEAAQINFYAPQLSIPTIYQAWNYTQDGVYTDPILRMTVGNFSASTSFDGIKISNLNAFSGQISIYGLDD
jgi:hypothetical protein